MLQDGGFVCGAVFDERFHVRHIVSDKQEDLSRMMGSKYAQSDMGHCYREIKEKLRAGKKVLFSGCPCQVAGLRAYLGKNDANLLLVELICHGIPSDQMLQAYIGMREKQYGAKLKRLEFRNKAKGWHNSSVRMEFENGKIYAEPMTIDAFMQGYFRGISLKESCFSCPFRSFASGSDFTIGDFWGAEIETPDIDDNKGLSAVISNSQKGTAFLEKASISCVPIKMENILKYNQALVRSFDIGAQRTDFYKYVAEHSAEEAIVQYFQEKRLQKIKRRILFVLRCAWRIARGKEKPLY